MQGRLGMERNMLLRERKGKITRWLAGIAFLICTMMLAGILASETTPRRMHLMLEPSVNGTMMTLEERYAYAGALTLTAVLPEWESRW